MKKYTLIILFTTIVKAPPKRITPNECCWISSSYETPYERQIKTEKRRELQRIKDDQTRYDLEQLKLQTEATIKRAKELDQKRKKVLKQKALEDFQKKVKAHQEAYIRLRAQLPKEIVFHIITHNFSLNEITDSNFKENWKQVANENYKLWQKERKTKL